MSTKLLSETICRKGLMVKCFVALIVFCCSVGEAFAQTNTKVTINVNNVLIRTALDQLQREAKIHFVYDEENIDSGKRVSLSYTETPLNAVLDDFCKQTSLRYEVKRNLILILPSKAEKTTGKHEPFYMTGVVTDETGESIIGATIMIGGTSQGTVTDIDGRYSLQVTPGDLVSFTFVGMADKVVKVQAGKKVVNVKMETNATALADVVVTGYQTLSKERATGSYSVISEKSTKGKLETDVLSRIEGLVAGINKTSSNSNDVVIRGITTYMGNTKPLYVVDGMPYEGDLASINPTDVQNITVLKDAAATAIYGSRGANGVIIVTTKKGKKGGLKFDVHYEGGITPITNSDLGLASTKTYFNIMDEARANVGLNPLDPQKDIIEPYYSNWTSPITREEAMNTDMDWVDLVTRMGHFHDINVALNQGGENSTTYASVNYRSDESSLKGLSMNAVSARLNSEFKKGIVTLGTQSFLKFDRKKSTNKWAVVSDKFPWRKVYDPEDPTGYWNPQMADGHPTATLDNDYQLSTGENFSFRTTLYMDVNLKWIKGLSVRADASYGYGLAQSDYWLSGLITNTGNVDGNQGNKSKKTTKSQQYHAFAKYNREWTDHGLDIVTGIEANRSYTDNAVVAGKNLSGEFQEPKIIGTMLGNNSAYIGGESYTFSFFNRIDYKFKQRYLLGASFVREGSSKFVKENRFGDFYSVSGGWIISDEAFMRNAGFISLLKLRGSYGETGNQNIPSEVTKNSYSIKSKQYYNNMQNMFLWNIANKAAKWEKNKSIDLGLDYALFNNKVNGSIAYYRRTTSDMLMRVQLPASAGITNSGGNADNNSMWANVGSMYNQGFEFDINVTLVKKDFEWNMNYNLTTNMNKVTALDASVDAKGTGIINTRPGAITKKDLALGTYFMAEWAGVDPEKGIGMIYEIDLDRYNKTGETVKTGRLIPATQSNVNKHRIIQEGKTALPKVYMGWTNNFKYKAFDLSFMFYLSLGSYTFNYHRYTKSFVGDGRNNVTADIYENSWKKPGDIAEYPQLRWQDKYNYDDNGNDKQNVTYIKHDAGHTKYLEKSAYLRLRNLTLGYTLPQRICSKINIDALRVYVSAVNLFTITSFNGYDPEVRVKNQTGANAQGAVFSGSEMPQTRIFSAGINFKF